MEILDLIAEFTFFNLIISAIFQPLTRRSLFDSLPRCLALTFSLTDICLHSWKPRQHFLSSVMLKRQIPCHVCFMRGKAQGMLSRYGHFLLVTLARFKCAHNSRVDDVSCPWADLTTEGLEPYHESCMMCECISSLTNPPWVPYFMCSFPSSGRLGPARAEIGLGFTVVGWFRRFRPPPPPLVWFRFRRPPVFLSLPFQGLPVLGQVCLCWCLLFPSSLALPSSHPGSAIFIPFSCSSHFHCHFICPAVAGSLCVPSV